VSDDVLFRAQDVVVDFAGRSQKRALDHVDFCAGAGEAIGIVGESGSGKTTLSRVLLGLQKVSSGTVTFGGDDIGRWRGRRRHELATQLQAVFQDPYRSLNPTRTVEQTLQECRTVARRSGEGTAQPGLGECLEMVGLPARLLSSYPRRLSGGQRQRVAIARAIVSGARFWICDEPTSALDISVQAQIINLLVDLRERLGLGYVFITHNLGVVRYVADRVVVMHQGRVVEDAATSSVLSHPSDPYTQSLLDAALVPDPVAQRQRREAREDMNCNEKKG